MTDVLFSQAVLPLLGPDHGRREVSLPHTLRQTAAGPHREGEDDRQDHGDEEAEEERDAQERAGEAAGCPLCHSASTHTYVMSLYMYVYMGMYMYMYMHMYQCTVIHNHEATCKQRTAAGKLAVRMS